MLRGGGKFHGEGGPNQDSGLPRGRPRGGTSKILTRHDDPKGVGGFRYFCSASGKCQVCATSVSSRWRLVRHLSDYRRPACRDALLRSPGSFSCLSDATVRKLDDQDRLLRREARRNGHSQILLSSGPTTRAGKRVGRIMRI